MPGRTHTPEFELDLMRQIQQGHKSRAQLCREHDLNPSLLHRWQQQYEQHGEHAFQPGKPTDDTQALERRVAELERLASGRPEPFLGQSTAEIAFLKNSLAAHRKKTGGK